MDDNDEILSQRTVAAATALHTQRNAAMLLMEIVEAAAEYWRGGDPYDFCVQHVSPDCIVFGGTNRLVWSPGRGFQPSRSHCTPAFLARCAAIGPLPRAARNS